MVVGDTVSAATVENSVEFPQILNLELPTIRSSNSTPGSVSKEDAARTSQTSLLPHSASLFPVAGHGHNLAVCQAIKAHRKCHTHAMESHSAFKKGNPSF